jgi:nucleoside-diphosphate-sugar epimerase
MSNRIAVTGATGFVGRHLAIALASGGYEVRALARRDDARLLAGGIELWRGDLDGNLDGLVEGCAAVVHVAGAVRGRDASHFHRVNAEGTARLAAASPLGSRFVLISSLAARHPHLSAYAASKAAGERLLLGHADRLKVAVIRPPAVYGPEDRATLPLLRGLAWGLLVHPAGRDARFSLLYADDLVRLACSLLADPPPSGTILEPDDGMSGGYGWSALAAIAGNRLGRRVRTVGVPRLPMTWTAWLSEQYGRRSREPPILSRGKVAELYHRDWVSDTRAMVMAPRWQPQVKFGDGLMASLAWYREAGWL